MFIVFFSSDFWTIEMFLIKSSYFVLKDHLFIVSLLFLFVFSLLRLKTFI